MSLTKIVFSKIFWLNIVIATILIAVGIWITEISLMKYTHHGETITVPDLRGSTLAQVDEFLKDRILTYQVLDSSYVVGVPPTAVLDQDPAPNSKVKENRKIYLTVNAITPPKVRMPALVDKSLRQASLELESWGLKVGQLKYRPDLAQNAVLDQQIKGVTINAGELVSKGTEIDLVLGDGLGNTKVEVPDLFGRYLDEAKFVLTASSLNLGGVIYDETVEDSSTAVIFKQFPQVKEDDPVMLNMGESVDVYLTQTLPDSLTTTETDTLDLEPEIMDNNE